MQEVQARQPLSGKTAVVTGGSSGIGAATVALLAAHGARVVIGYHQGEQRAEDLRKSLPPPSHAAEHLSFRIPLDDSGTHEALAARLAGEGAGVAILVNCAGYTSRIPHADLDRLDGALFNEILAANVGGTYSIIRALMPLLRKSGAATIVSVSSVSAFTGSGSSIAYCAAKAAIDTMTLSLARVFGPAVRCLCVSPASVDTGFVPGRSSEDVRRKGEATPLGRAVEPADVALAVLGCITHMRTATGTRFVIDGGFTL